MGPFSTRRPVHPREAARVALVAMPFGPKHLPALGLSLLKPLLEAAGFAVDVRYGTVAFAEVLGPDAYERISDSSSDLLLGDWVFADAIRARDDAAIADYVEALRRRRRGLGLAKEAVRARALAPAFVASFVDKLLEPDPLVVAFTSTFAQNAASLAAARLVKERRPGVKVVFGGANCEGEMGLELLRRFPFIDAAVSGEGESVAVELFRRLVDGVGLSGVKGVYSQADPPDRAPETTTRFADLDQLPIPDFHDFIDAVANLGPAARDLEPHLLVEASRGCWWGEKHHCTFCGLNGTALAFRSKSAERFVDELLFLSNEYRTNGFMAVDNILDHRYLKTALPMLAERGAGINLFFEVKSNLRREQVELLHGSGVRAIQAGIESLDSSVLAVMRKGVTGIQNVQLLRLCKEFGIRVSWNMLYGFPGEDPAAYARMAKQ
jgi:ribosomal peptide maturation radical SAM protein 1